MVLDLSADAYLNVYYHATIIQIYLRLTQFYLEENHELRQQLETKTETCIGCTSKHLRCNFTN